MDRHFRELKDKIEKRTAVVGVIGLGYVGLPMCVELARAGFQVHGIDNNSERVAQLHRLKTYILDVSDQDLDSVRNRFAATTDFSVLAKSDAVIICVPTPLRKTKDPDLSYILSANTEIRKHLHPGQLVILESTTYPGTTDEVILPELESSGLKVGTDFFLCFSPERIDPGNRQFGVTNTPKIVGGVTQHCGALAEMLYRSIIHRVFRVSSTRASEMVKLLENTFRAINIGMVNEMAIMCDKLGINTWEVIEAAATKPFGFMPFYPGPGLGGHCIPIDPHYLSWKLKTLNYSARFIELAGEINSSMPHYVVDKIADALNDDRKSVRGSRIVILGVAYKRDSNDLRESPALDVYRLLEAKGADVVFHDPHIPEMSIESRVVRSQDLNETLLGGADCVVIVTDHSAYNWQYVVDHSRLIFDCRNATGTLHSEKCRVLKL
jgi:UDP-N-acetyl-D-glucosamine dehydrogenase